MAHKSCGSTAARMRHLTTMALLLASGNALAQQAASQGIYRIPFEDGTKVKVTNDHLKHTPPGRIDMSGTGGSNYRIVAAADGVVRHVVDKFSERLTCKDGVVQNNNYVWIEHANGEWTKYTHMAKGSSSSKAGLKVGQQVKAGTYLGDESDVGCADGDHLHFEVGVPRETDGILATGGFLQDNSGSKRNRIPRICGIEQGQFVSGKSYTARKVPGTIGRGQREVARHGVPAADFQCLFDQAVDAGYALKWIDGFDHQGKVYYNAVFGPAAGTASAAFFGLDAAQFQKRFDEFTTKGYRPHQVESYASGGKVRYAAIFDNGRGPAYSAYHGLSASDHQKRMDELVAAGYRPRNVSVVSIGGKRSYTTLYGKTDLGGWQARSQLTASEYQKAFEDNQAKGRRLVYLDAHVHEGQPHYSAIWSSKPATVPKARHGLTGSQYQMEWQASTAAGMSTAGVTGYGTGDGARYAAFWQK